MTSTTSTTSIFQAIGVIVGKINFDDNKAIVQINFAQTIYSYPLYFLNKPRLKKAYSILKEKVESGCSTFKLLVYPQITHFPRSKNESRPILIGFALIAFSEDISTQTGMFEKLKPLEFNLAGVYQRIPVCSTPCVTIYRNFSESRFKFLKTTQPVFKVRALKPVHIPLFWKDSPIIPFSFNPKFADDKKKDIYFIEIKAKFLPQRNAFGHLETISDPSLILPKHLRASKENKAQALKEKRKLKLDNN